MASVRVSDIDGKCCVFVVCRVMSRRVVYCLVLFIASMIVQHNYAKTMRFGGLGKDRAALARSWKRAFAHDEDAQFFAYATPSSLRFVAIGLCQ